MRGGIGDGVVFWVCICVRISWFGVILSVHSSGVGGYLCSLNE